jgi:hypothetical protein
MHQVVIVTPTEIAELFAEAQRLGHQDFGGLGLRFFRRTRQSLRKPLPEPARRPTPPRPHYAVQMPRQLVRIHVPPLRGERVSECACGGWMERREGVRGLTHVGSRECRGWRAF